MAVLVVLLAVFGVLAMRQGTGGGEGANGPGREGDAPQGEASGVPEDVMGLLPYSEAELQAGARVAAGFVQQYATTDPAESMDDRLERLTGDTTDDFAQRLEQTLSASSLSGGVAGASGLEGGGGAGGAVRTEATVHGIRSVGETSVVFLVSATAGSGGEERAQEYAATVAHEDGRWLIYDVQFADVGDGDGSPAGGGAP
ncbi:hypothetical protein [Nocardiopsis coralliicola]